MEEKNEELSELNLNEKKTKKGIYKRRKIVYDNPEQSRKLCVKCHRDGELPGGRRNFPR